MTVGISRGREIDHSSYRRSRWQEFDFDDLSFGEIGRLMDDDIRKPVRVTRAHCHDRQADGETRKSVQFGSRLMRHHGAKSSRCSH